MKSIKRKLQELIRRKYEGAYWDYKQQYHTNKADLLHDIICLANNTENRDAYLIFGVADDGKIVGVEGDENRRNQESFITFLRSKDFQGGYRPIVEHRSIDFNNHSVDVLIIKKSNRTPYYLIKDFFDGKMRVKAFYIYSRIMDTNTPKDESADESIIESLWKRRFGLLPLPIDRLKYALMDKENWSQRASANYYNPSPEFTVIKIEEDTFRNNNLQFYSYNQMNQSTYYETLQCKYYNTVLFESEIVILDSGRYVAVVPEWGFISTGRNRQMKLAYKYYVEDSLGYCVNQFLYEDKMDEATIAMKRFIELILIYSSVQEKERFELFIINNLDLVIKELEERKAENLIFDSIEEQVREFENERIHTGFLLNLKLKEFRNINV